MALSDIIMGQATNLRGLFMGSKQGESKNDTAAPTLDGTRIGRNELNLGQVRGQSRLQRWLRNLSHFLAGMYTGESCAGSPHSHRKPDPDARCKSD